ncbi:AsmA-like C-terminal region-containing protein [Maribellus sp. YY47]|uniref:AsmA family protein n=1 Tax=Maribellus sp. YY47 TaxID=2929486 RepID=UPI00200086EE|nr:AsmA-like C-terminal region-containing protein [Maribellus sp. YY47]MCK3685282.1 AsmA family protein [Maribellus sp. YY47]
MKRIIIILLVIIFVIVGALVAIPVFFKQNLLDYAKRTLNKELNAKVELADLKISLFRNFPKASVDLKDMLITGTGAFENDTLLSIPSLRTTIDLASLFNPSDMEVESIVIDQAFINLLVNENGAANWDLVPAGENQAEQQAELTSEDDFQLNLDKIEILHSHLKYTDKSLNMNLALSDVNLDVTGKMYGQGTSLETGGNVGDFSLEYGGIQYISKTTLAVKTLLDVDFESMNFTITENELMVNRLPLELGGSFKMPSDTVFFDLQLNTKSSGFENFLALVPPVYESYMKDIHAQGNADIKGALKGFYFGEDYPEFSLNINIQNGNLRYADMPEEIKNIRAAVNIEKPQGDLDLTKINVNEAHAEIHQNPVDFTLAVSTPMSDPYFDGALKGKVNLSHLKNALPMDSVNMSGVIDANLMARGSYSDVEAEKYDKIRSDGTVSLQNFVYETPELTQPVLVPKGNLSFSPDKITLSEFLMQLGESDFRLSGTVSNYLNYFLKEGVLNANLQLNSKRVNLNELLRLQAEDVAVSDTKAEKSAANEEEDNVLAFDVPDKINVTFRSDIDNAVFNRIPIRNITGVIKAADQKLTLQNLTMDMLEGKMNMNGSYKNTPDNKPIFDFGFDISSFDIPTMFRTLSGFKNMLPGAGNSTGKLSSKFALKGQLGEKLSLIPASANGSGTFSTQNLEIVNSPVFNQLNGIIKAEKLKDIRVADFVANLNVENGNLLLKPFKTKVIGQETTVAGTLSVENLIDMRLDFNVERDAFGPDIQKILAVIPGNEKIKMLPAGVVINGPVGNPKVSPDLSKTTKAVTDATKDDVKNSLDKLGKGLLKLIEK